MYDVGLSGRDVLQRCERHKRVSARQRQRHVSRFMFRRALKRGLVLQLELLVRLEEVLESGMRTWEYQHDYDDDLVDLDRLMNQVEL